MKTLNIYSEQGADFHQELILLDGNNLPIDLTSAIITSSICKSILSTHVAHFTITPTEPIIGKVVVSLSHDITTLLNGRYYYIISVEINNNDNINMVGVLTVNRNIL